MAMNCASEIHDHFDGTEFCVQCNGRCKLDGLAMFASSMVRYAIYAAVQNNRSLPHMVKYSIREAGLDVDALMARCRESEAAGAQPKIYQAPSQEQAPK